MDLHLEKMDRSEDKEVLHLEKMDRSEDGSKRRCRSVSGEDGSAFLIEDKEVLHSSTAVFPIIAAATRVMGNRKHLHSSAIFRAYCSISRETGLSLKAILRNNIHASTSERGCPDSSDSSASDSSNRIVSLWKIWGGAVTNIEKSL
jgi:hypothetical protein